MNEEQNVSYGEIKEKIKDLQLTVLVNFFECAMYQKYGAGWKEKTIKKAKDKIRKNDHGNSYKTLVTFYDNNGGFEKTNLEISVTVALIEHDFLQACCKYKNLPNEILRSKVDKLREDRNKEAHSPLERDDYKKCANTLNNLEEFMDFLDEHSWKFEASKNFMKYLRDCGHDIDKEITFLEKARNRLVNYRAFLENISKSKEINDYKTVKVVFVDEEQKALDGISCTIISNLTHIERGRFDEVKRFSVLLEPGEYSIVCNSVPEGYKEFVLKQLQIDATGEADVDIAITVEKKYGNNYSREVETDNVMKGSELIFQKGCEAYNYSKEHNTDYTQAFKLFREAAEQGHIGAKFNLGKMYFNGEGVVEDWQEALKYLEESAKNGYIDAQYYLGRIFMEGTEVEKDEQKAYQYLKKSAEFGNAEAQCYLGKYYSQKVDYEKAVEWYKKAAAQGNAFSLYALGAAYTLGEVVGKDLKRAFEFFTQAAERGSLDAMNTLGDMYLNGSPILEKDETKAFYWYHKAAMREDAYALNKLAACYEYSVGVEQDHKKAVRYWSKAAELGNANAQFMVGVVYRLNGDKEKAIEWYKKAAAQGNIEGLKDLGAAYFDGMGVEQNYEEAFKCFEKAAIQGDAEALAEVGQMYLEGLGTNKNISLAIENFRKSAEYNNAKAEFFLGFIYENAVDGLKADYNEALKWYTKSSEHGCTRALYAIGTLYLDDKKIKQDYHVAYTYFLKSAENGQVESIFYLGFMYENGLGVEKNYNEAVKWYNKASEKGYIPAVTNAARIHFYAKDFETAQGLFEISAKYRDVEAEAMLGYMYENGLGVEQNYEEAIKWYIKASEQGFEGAVRNLFKIYLDGKGIAQYKEKVFECIKKNAEDGQAEAQYILGRIFHINNDLIGINKNYEEAIRWYIQASNQGIEDAMCAIGDMYYRGYNTAHEINYVEAFKWYEKAAEHGSVAGLVNLAEIYASGKGIERNYEKAFEYYKKAADTGEVVALFSMGYMYANGLGVEKNYEEAYKSFYIASMNNYIPAMSLLGYYYQKGFGVERNIDEAKKWYKKAIAGGDEEAKQRLKALEIDENTSIENLDINDLKLLVDNENIKDKKYNQYKLGKSYEKGYGVNRNLKEAARYYRLAIQNDCQEAKVALINLLKQYPNLTDAENPICLMDYLSSSKLYNDANYQYKIALCYEHGVDCKQNIQEAYSWYKKAANQGYQLAEDACDRLEQSYPELAPKKTTGFWGKLFG